jgi:hypothetical protein
MKPSAASKSPVDNRLWIGFPLLVLICLKFLVHLLLSGRYGYYRDELYYLVCGSYLDLGFVDHPPLVPAVASFVQGTLGDSLAALRLLPAFAGAGLVLMTGLMARQMGGGRQASTLAGLAVFAAPLFLRSHSMLTPAAFEGLFWAAACCLLLAQMKPRAEDPPSWTWLALGLLLGLGTLNRYSLLLLVASVLGGILLAPSSRRAFALSRNVRTAGAGIVLALVILLPNLIWQIQQGWPTLEFWRNLQRGILSGVSLGEFAAGQLFFLNPLAAPLWLAGLVWVFKDQEGRRFKAFGWSYILLLLFFALAKGKVYYLGPAYPVLLAAGAVALEKRFRFPAGARYWAKPILTLWVGLWLGWAAWVAPLVLPLLPLEKVESRARAVTLGHKGAAVLAGHFFDMFGWPELATHMARHWQDLTPQERAGGLVLAGNYGEASALNVFGRKQGLPFVFCGHNHYYLWGLGNFPRKTPEIPPGHRDGTGSVCLALGVARSHLEWVFDEVEKVSEIPNDQGSYYERNLPVYLCRQPRLPWKDAWPRFKLYQ